MHKFLIILLVISCSSVQHKKNANFADQRVDSYLSKWKKENAQLLDREFKGQYSKYLDSVEKVFLREGMAKNIDFYLDSLKAIDKSVNRGNESYDELYAQNSPRTKKTSVITELYDSLLDQRSDELLEYYGFNFYSELMKNRNKFVKKEESGINFPL